MKLQTKFMKGILLPITLGLIINFAVVMMILFTFSYESINSEIKEKLINKGLELSATEIYNLNTMIQKVVIQSKELLDMQINHYISLIQALKSPIKELREGERVSCVQLAKAYDATIGNHNPDETPCWFVSDKLDKILSLSPVIKQQLYVLSFTEKSTIAIHQANTKFMLSSYFSFDETNLLYFFNVAYLKEDDLIPLFEYDNNNPLWCIDQDGKRPTYFFFKCRDWYLKMQEQLQLKPNQDFFILPPYFRPKSQLLIVTICRKFYDDISNGTGNLCLNINNKEVFSTFDGISGKLMGHFLVAIVNSTLPLYYPKIEEDKEILPISEYEFNELEKYYLEELTDFSLKTLPVLVSDYSSTLNSSHYGMDLMTEINIGSETSFFIKNKQTFYYRLYPIYLRQFGKNLHMLTVVYVYEEKFFILPFLNKQKDLAYNMSIICIGIVSIMIIMIGILYQCMIKLSLYIVIPIKNMRLMLMGIQIGGSHRIEYIQSLSNNNHFKSGHSSKITSSDNTEYHKLSNEDTQSNDEESCILQTNEQSSKQLNNSEIIDLKKYDGSLLEYRPKEINQIIHILLRLQKVFLLTSNPDTTGQRKEMINYSMSEKLFEDVRMDEGKYICQSNIGNLSFLCKKYDKAIYHLALSLEDAELTKYLNCKITDEIDQHDELLSKLKSIYKHDKNDTERKIKEDIQREDIDSLTIPLKIIRNLIYNRYPKLLHSYQCFFDLLQNSTTKHELLESQYLNTKYHTLYYYQKMCIQYIYLSFSSNDIIKRGQSILSYLNYLIKFALIKEEHNYNDQSNTTVEKETYFFGIEAIINKILKWLTVFKMYKKYYFNNNIIPSEEILIREYLRNKDLKAIGLLFHIIIQHGHFIKGQFSFICKDYNNALKHFVKSSRDTDLIIDESIKCQSLDYIQQIIDRIREDIEYHYYVSRYTKETFIELQTKARNALNNFEEEITDQIKDMKINENSNEKNDVVIIFDCLYLEDQQDIRIIQEQIETIITSYMNINDRIAVLYIDTIHKLLLPIIYIKDLDQNKVYESIKKIQLANIIKEAKSLTENAINGILSKALNYSIGYLTAKHVNKDKMFLIWMTNFFNNGSANNPKELIQTIVNQSSNRINLIILGNIQHSYQEYFHKNKSSKRFKGTIQCIPIIDMKNLKTLLYSRPIVSNQIEFLNEKYDSYQASFTPDH